jgi:hypothetical protein
VPVAVPTRAFAAAGADVLTVCYFPFFKILILYFRNNIIMSTMEKKFLFPFPFSLCPTMEEHQRPRQEEKKKRVVCAAKERHVCAGRGAGQHRRQVIRR